MKFNTLLQQVGAESGRIFMVEKDFIERDNKLSELREFLGYSFWVRNEETGKIRTLGVPRLHPDRDPEYYQRLDELATELANGLNHLKNQMATESKSSDLDQNSVLQRRLKKIRLQNEKARLGA